MIQCIKKSVIAFKLFYSINNSQNKLLELFPASNNVTYGLWENKHFIILEWKTKQCRNTFIMSSCTKNIYLSVCLSVRSSVHPSARLHACLSICLSVCPSIRPPAGMPICLSVYLSVRLPVCLSFCPSVCLHACLSVCWTSAFWKYIMHILQHTCNLLSIVWLVSLSIHMCMRVHTSIRVSTCVWNGKGSILAMMYKVSLEQIDNTCFASHWNNVDVLGRHNFLVPAKVVKKHIIKKFNESNMQFPWANGAVPGVSPRRGY